MSNGHDGGTKVPDSLWEMMFKAAERYGIAAVLCGVLLYWGRQDRTELCKRLDEQRATNQLQNEFIQNKLIATIENNTKALEHVYSAIPKGANQ